MAGTVLMKIFVVMHVQGGLLQDLRGFSEPTEADEYEKELCKENGLPFDRDEREKYYEENEWEDEIYRYDMTIEAKTDTPDERLHSIAILTNLVAKHDFEMSVNTFEELLQLIEEYLNAMTNLKVTTEKT
jgi:hypothetical protein